jgi:uncharacterized protein YbjT (DUF2867 family)
MEDIMQSPARIAVAGATGRVGRHIAAVLAERGYGVAPISRAQGVDVITGDGLDAALQGAAAIIDASTGPSPEQAPATEFFTTATRNLQAAGQRAGVGRIVAVSIVGTDRSRGGYALAKLAHEEAMLAGPVPASILRATQFHEFVAQLLDWGTNGDIAYVPQMRTQIVAARAVAEVAADLATAPGLSDGPFTEVAGPRVESMPELAALFAARRGYPAKVEGVSDPANPDRELYEGDGMLPGAGAIVAGPTFEEWLVADWRP